MKLSVSDLSELANLAILAATQAGQMIARSRPSEIEYKPGGASLGGTSLGGTSLGGTSLGGWTSIASQVVTEIDRRSEDMILSVLTPTLERFQLGLLTEEQDDNGSRLTADYFWCVDPLDGTLPFIEGVPGHAVSIALVGKDGTPWIGVVYDPVEQTVLHAIRGAGAFRNGLPWPTEPPTRGQVLSVFADRSFVASDDHEVAMAALGRIAQDMSLTGVTLHATGGAVMNACGVLAQPPACYFKYPKPTGGGSMWDFAATACLFHEIGAVAIDIYGGPLDLNRADSSNMNHKGVLFATNEALAERIRSIS